MEKNRNKVKRKEYLLRKKELEKQFPDSLWVFLDETFIHKNFMTNEIIIYKNELPDVNLPIGKGLRFSLIHAGSVNGFVENTGLILVDQEINGETFENWLKNKLLPNLPEKSIICLDNAQTHSKQYSQIPNQNTEKEIITKWLTTNNIPFHENAKKKYLLALVKENAPEKHYSVDKIIENAGHISLRFPPYHCIFNPIENVWSQMKQFFGKHNLNNNKEQIEELILKSFEEITPENWKQYCKELENEFWLSDGILDLESSENVIINFGEESESDTSDEEMIFSDILAENNNNVNFIGPPRFTDTRFTDTIH
jgi:transposase